MNRAEKRRQKKLAEKAAKSSLRGQAPVFISQAPDPELEKVLQQALRNHSGGNLPLAEAGYRQVLQSNADHVDALHLLGVLRHQTGGNEEAVKLISKAVSLNPGFAEAHCNMGVALQALGRAGDAERAFRTAIKIKPDYADARYNLGNALRDLGQFEDAEAGYRKAIEYNPRHADAFGNLGNLLKEIDRLEEAVECYRQALAIKPSYAEIHSNLGNVLRRLNRPEDAIENLRKAITANPGLAEAYGNLGAAYEEIGDDEQAARYHRQAINKKPDYAEARCNLAHALVRLGNLEEAVDQFRRSIVAAPTYLDAHLGLARALVSLGGRQEAIAQYLKVLEIDPTCMEARTNLGLEYLRDDNYEDASSCFHSAIRQDASVPENHYNLGQTVLRSASASEAFEHFRKTISLNRDRIEFWSGYVICAEHLEFSSYDRELADEFLTMLDQAPAIPKRLAKAVMSLVHQHPFMPKLNAIIDEGRLDDQIHDVAAELSDIPLLTRLMDITTINDRNFELTLTQVRKSMLLSVVEGKDQEAVTPFHRALANHCYVNGFLFFETDMEKEAVSTLRERISQGGDISPIQVAVLATYEPLHKLSIKGRLATIELEGEFAEIVQRHIVEPELERTLRREIPVVGTISDDVSHSVRQQYEENPYPVWIKRTVYPEPGSVAEVLRDIPLNMSVLEGELPDVPDILIAGCGTGQQAILTHSRYRDCRMVAVDLSLSSLSYAIRKSREFGIDDIDYRQCDILELAKLGKSFDIIESRGVLHHMADPIAGWQTLVELLRPRGLMKIGLYSKIARRGIRKSRDLIAQMGLGSTPREIREFRKMIQDGRGSVDPEIGEHLRSSDFYSISETRDLVFHQQEHQFTLLEIDEALEQLGLRFLGFELSNATAIHRFRQMFPDRNARQSLANWHEFETRFTREFGQLYEFWVQKK